MFSSFCETHRTVGRCKRNTQRTHARRTRGLEGTTTPSGGPLSSPGSPDAPVQKDPPGSFCSGAGRASNPPGPRARGYRCTTRCSFGLPPHSRVGVRRCPASGPAGPLQPLRAEGYHSGSVAGSQVECRTPDPIGPDHVASRLRPLGQGASWTIPLPTPLGQTEKLKPSACSHASGRVGGRITKWTLSQIGHKGSHP